MFASVKVRVGIVTLPLLLAGCSPPATSGETATATEGQAEARPQRIVNKVKWYSGMVSAVGPGWVEYASGWRLTNSEAWRENGDGSRTLLQRESYDNTRPKRIVTTGTRPGGDYDCEQNQFGVPDENHFAGDVRIGDQVEICAGASHEGEEWTMHLRILRRPGGTIPPLVGEAPHGHAGRLGDQAEQDWEEKGIPIPKQYLDKDSRAPWTNPPYPPVAPMPRPAKP